MIFFEPSFAVFSHTGKIEYHISPIPSHLTRSCTI